MSRNKPLADCADFEANIRRSNKAPIDLDYYQKLNQQIEQKTCAVFDLVNKLNNSKNSESNYQFTEKSKTDASYQFHERNKNTSPDGSVSPLARPELREKSSVNKHKIIVDLTQRLREIQNELETARHQQKQTEEERDQQKQELSQLKENLKKMKISLQSKQLLHDAHKKEMAIVLEKLKSEEQSRKSFQKDFERISKQLSVVTSDKEKLAEKLEHSKTDLLLLKQHKLDDHPSNKVPIMLKCIRKQSFLIENLMKQISCLEQLNKQ